MRTCLTREVFDTNNEVAQNFLTDKIVKISTFIKAMTAKNNGIPVHEKGDIQIKFEDKSVMCALKNVYVSILNLLKFLVVHLLQKSHLMERKHLSQMVE